MLYKKKVMIILTFCLFIILNINTVYASDTFVEITLEGKVVNTNKNETTLYITDEPIELKKLPQTDEVIVSFVYFVLGLSLVVVVFGVYFNKFYMNSIDIRWRH